jgi:mono/diheme cytochrome c family protein
MKRIAALAAAGVLAFATAGCHDDMWTQPKVKPLDRSDFFADGFASRPKVTHTVARGQLAVDDALHTGVGNGSFVKTFPFKLTKADLEIGQTKFNIYCSPCHGAVGDGKGMIAQRGLNLRRPPATYHTDRLRKMPVGHLFDVITNGYGVMYSYASRIDVEDRWRVIGYIRVLQTSQNVPENQLTEQNRKDIENPAGAQAHDGEHGSSAGSGAH